MKQGVFSVYDEKAKTFSPPFYAANAAVACRMMEDVLRDKNHPFTTHSADYTLFQICEFDQTTGTFENDSQVGSYYIHKNLGNLVTFKGDDNV